MSTNKPSETTTFDPKAAAEERAKRNREKVLGATGASVASQHSVGTANSNTTSAESGLTPAVKKTTKYSKAVLEALKLLNESYEKNKEIFERLNIIYKVLKNHLEHEGVYHGEKNDMSLMEYLGFDEKNLTEILIALFGENPHTDQADEIQTKIRETVVNSQEFIIIKMFEVEEGSNINLMQLKLERLVERLKKMKNLRNFPKAHTDNIKQAIDMIQAKETPKKKEDPKVILTKKSQIDIAKKIVSDSKLELNIFDATYLAELIKGHTDGRVLDVYQDDDDNDGQAPSAQTPVVAPGVPAAPAVQAAPVVPQSAAPVAISPVASVVPAVSAVPVAPTAPSVPVVAAPVAPVAQKPALIIVDDQNAPVPEIVVPAVTPAQPAAAPIATPVAPVAPAAPQGVAPESAPQDIDFRKLTRDKTVIIASVKLQDFLESLNQPGTDMMDLLTRINQVDIKDESGKGIAFGYQLLTLKDDADLDIYVIAEKIAAIFSITDTAKLGEKIKQIHKEFSEKGIYPPKK